MKRGAGVAEVYLEEIRRMDSSLIWVQRPDEGFPTRSE
jgi:hypothetical protein